MLTGTLVTVAGFVPIGFARSSAGEYTFSIFAVVAIALIASWIVAVVFSPLARRRDPEEAEARARSGAGPDPARLPRRSGGGHASALADHPRHPRAIRGGLYGMRFVPQQFFPASDRPELLVDLKLPQNGSIYASRDVVGAA